MLTQQRHNHIFEQIIVVSQARTQPKIYGGPSQFFQDLYVYIFVLLEFICIIYGRIMCEKAKKK